MTQYYQILRMKASFALMRRPVLRCVDSNAAPSPCNRQSTARKLSRIAYSHGFGWAKQHKLRLNNDLPCSLHSRPADRSYFLAAAAGTLPFASAPNKGILTPSARCAFFHPSLGRTTTRQYLIGGLMLIALGRITRRRQTRCRQGSAAMHGAGRLKKLPHLGRGR